ncbi:MAG: 4-hydroxythreonine-4-phosphate dehydrogenase PdxA [Ignavibacteriae bacterium]|nr:4-hydroxythreonine-4-phosphate dehydrogenase PdxA [Ignavibacteriota bacterium]
MRTTANKPIIAITVGDFNGIGPEVALKALTSSRVRRGCLPVLVGPADVFAFYAKRLNIPVRLDGPEDATLTQRHSGRIPVVECAEVKGKISPGRISAAAGKVAAAAIAHAVNMITSGDAHAMVTAPVSKKSMHLAGADFPGQTEMVQHLSGSPRVAMMLASKTMRVGLATIHIPVKEVAAQITPKRIRETIEIVHQALKTDWRIRSPRIAVLALNPHASEGGDIGREDIDIVEPVIAEYRRKRFKIDGPFPADAFFGKYKAGMYDAVIAMYHDQGLIPLKMTSFGEGVNISVGLNIVRTSPDHGTAFDIAGKGIASPGSMIEAILLAAQVAVNRTGDRQK